MQLITLPPKAVVWSDWDCWRKKKVQQVVYLPPEEILKEATKRSTTRWVIGSAELNAQLLATHWVRHLHLWWAPFFAASPSDPTLCLPFPLSRKKGELRLNLKLKRFLSTSTGSYGYYTQEPKGK